MTKIDDVVRDEAEEIRSKIAFYFRNLWFGISCAFRGIPLTEDEMAG